VTVCVLFFGHWRDHAGTGKLSLELPESATVFVAAEELTRQNPKLAGVLDKVRVAVGEEFASPETVLKENDELAFLPPMSGG
jgi:molybdopterin converting factor subunit 1